MCACVERERARETALTWCAIPASGDIVRQDGLRTSRLSNGPTQTEITYFDVAVGIQEDVGWFDVSVQEVCRVQVLECLQQLPNDVFLVDICEDACSNDSVQVSLHVVKCKVNVSVVFGLDHMLQSNDVLVSAECLQVHDLSKGALGVYRVAESVETLLQRYYLSCALVDDFPDNAIRLCNNAKSNVVNKNYSVESSYALAESLANFELANDVSLDIFRRSGHCRRLH
jgi:hypothetical protein